MVEMNRLVQRRQSARAARMGRVLGGDTPYGFQGKVRCGLALALFLGCCFVFMLGDSETYRTPINQLESEYQLAVSLGVSLVSIALLLPSFRYHKFIIGLTIVAMLAMGVVMPRIWHARVPGENALPDEPAKVQQEKPTQAEEPVKKAVALTESDLDVYRETCKEFPQNTHYAIYIDNQTSATRSLVRDALSRLLQAEYTRAYTRADGALYVVTNVRGKRTNVARIAARFGKVLRANPDAGVYEVSFSADKANLVSRYSSEVLTSPQNPNFVAANVAELMCLDPMRVMAAANMLTSSNVRVLRGDIRDAILQVLRDPWTSEPDTHRALLEALVTYAPRGDEQTLPICRKYFDNCRMMQQEMSPVVLRRLISEDPDGMVEPIVQLWSASPVLWNDMIAALGSRAEEQLVAKMNVDSDLQTLDSVLKYLSGYGTAKSVPAVQSLLEHPDSLIRHKAGETLRDIEKRIK